VKKIEKYYKKRTRNLQLLLKIPRSNYTVGMFHDLRIEIKKLRSVLELLKFCADDFKWKKLGKPFDQLFKQAGIIRDIHVEEEMLEKYFSIEFLQEYRRKLREKNSQELKNYNALVRDLESVIEKSFKRTDPWIAQVSKRKINDFISKRKSKIRILINENLIQPIQIHLLRKRIKQYSYSLKIAYNGISILKEMDMLADLTGKWHDQRVLLHHLDQQFHRDGVDSKELEEIEKVRDEQIILNNITFNEITSIIRKLTF
jgi:CHAD domain-containing protein